MPMQNFLGAKRNLEKKFKSFIKTVYLYVFIVILFTSRNVVSVTLRYQMKNYKFSTLKFDKVKITTDVPQQTSSIVLQKNKDDIILTEEPSFNAIRVPIVVGLVISIVVGAAIIVSICMLSKKHRNRSLGNQQGVSQEALTRGRQMKISCSVSCGIMERLRARRKQTRDLPTGIPEEEEIKTKRCKCCVFLMNKLQCVRNSNAEPPANQQVSTLQNELNYDVDNIPPPYVLFILDREEAKPSAPPL
ncbi:uncharacterized protein LOC143241977 [Tachypleus tridentatus]|uniref:uncharacterized protein LOC143241977 n=1 Tax=Tachypleus tridentatus TaxID=6853 RepID=UPI003FD2866A